MMNAAKTKQRDQVQEIKRYMGLKGKLPISEWDENGLVILDFRAEQDPKVIFRIQIDAQGKFETNYVW